MEVVLEQLGLHQEVYGHAENRTEMDGVQSCNLTPQDLHDKSGHGIPNISGSNQMSACVWNVSAAGYGLKYLRNLPVDNLGKYRSVTFFADVVGSLVPTWLAMARTRVSGTGNSEDINRLGRKITWNTIESESSPVSE